MSYINHKRSIISQSYKYKLKRCSNKECCKQCRYVMFKGTMTKWLVQILTQLNPKSCQSYQTRTVSERLMLS